MKNNTWPTPAFINNVVKQWRKHLHACVAANSGHF